MTKYQTRYKILHWVMAVLILGQIPVGLYMADLKDGAPFKNELYELHKSFGLILFLLVALRVFWKRHNRVEPVATLTNFELIASTATHHLLLALLVIMPTTGYLATSSCCSPVKPFGLFNVAFPYVFSEKTTEILFLIHNYAGKLMLLLVLAHIGAALFHHFIKKDGVLKRMLK